MPGSAGRMIFARIIFPHRCGNLWIRYLESTNLRGCHDWFRRLLGSLSGAAMPTVIPSMPMVPGDRRSRLAPQANGMSLLAGQLGLPGTRTLIGFTEEFATGGCHHFGRP